ncbi:MAG: hypothetical protein U5K70_01440 [Halodesulfurarchaeum sp.]|nr:hypothetical protein [Halodesulfurarchaeum sp.]
MTETVDQDCCNVLQESHVGSGSEKHRDEEYPELRGPGSFADGVLAPIDVRLGFGLRFFVRFVRGFDFEFSRFDLLLRRVSPQREPEDGRRHATGGTHREKHVRPESEKGDQERRERSQQ